MLHYFLVVLVYAGFIGIVYAYENKSGIGSGISLSVPFSFYIMYLVILFSVYERITHISDPAQSKYSQFLYSGLCGGKRRICDTFLCRCCNPRNDIRREETRISVAYSILMIALIINVLLVVEAANLCTLTKWNDVRREGLR